MGLKEIKDVQNMAQNMKKKDDKVIGKKKKVNTCNENRQGQTERGKKCSWNGKFTGVEKAVCMEQKEQNGMKKQWIFFCVPKKEDYKKSDFAIPGMSGPLRKKNENPVKIKV